MNQAIAQTVQNGTRFRETFTRTSMVRPKPITQAVRFAHGLPLLPALAIYAGNNTGRTISRLEREF